MYECGTCNDSFWYYDDWEDHMGYEDHDKPECETCPRTFHTWRACNQHMGDTDHWAPWFECETCAREFRSQAAANQHMNAVGHWAPKFACETCNKRFYTQKSADQHMRQLAHYRNYCKECNRIFNNENNLRMHLNSNTHRGKDMPCPFCSSRYTSASGLTHHLEGGSCPRAPQLNREIIHRMVRERDPHGIITNKQIEWHETQSTTYSATNMAFNGDCWECYVCHKGFMSANALNSHLNSPVHKEKVYHCPNWQGKCGMQFTTLAAFFNHLESEKCGFMRFDKVQRQAGNVLQGHRLIAF